jgi:hypothetical protein
LNQLPPGNRHRAVGIDFHRDVIQSQSSGLRSRHAALFGIGPVFILAGIFARLRRHFVSFLLAAHSLGCRSGSEFIDSLQQRIGGGHCASTVVCHEHSRENIGCGKSNLRQRSVCGGRLQRKCVFELVRQFTQFPQPTSCRVAFQSVYRPADRTHDLLIAGIFFQLQRFFVQRLQQFLRGLKEKFSQFRSALVE